MVLTSSLSRGVGRMQPVALWLKWKYSFVDYCVCFDFFVIICFAVKEKEILEFLHTLQTLKQNLKNMIIMVKENKNIQNTHIIRG